MKRLILCAFIAVSLSGCVMNKEYGDKADYNWTDGKVADVSGHSAIPQAYAYKLANGQEWHVSQGAKTAIAGGESYTLMRYEIKKPSKDAEPQTDTAIGDITSVFLYRSDNVKNAKQAQQDKAPFMSTYFNHNKSQWWCSTVNIGADGKPDKATLYRNLQKCDRVKDM